MKLMERLDAGGLRRRLGADSPDGAAAADLHHPLLINLAYVSKFHSVLVMDVCHGDLEDFGAGEQLTSKQVHFVGMEVCAVLAYLQTKQVMFRDLKPANLLIDDFGRQMIDFGAPPRARRTNANLDYRVWLR